MASAVTTRSLQKAEAALRNGDAKRDAGRADEALNAYRKAYEFTVRAMNRLPVIPPPPPPPPPPLGFYAAQAYLKSPNPEASDLFGVSVAVVVAVAG